MKKTTQDLRRRESGHDMTLSNSNKFNDISWIGLDRSLGYSGLMIKRDYRADMTTHATALNAQYEKKNKKLTVLQSSLHQVE